MAIYRVTMFYTASKTVDVEADTMEEAIEQAESNDSWISLCHQCASEFDDTPAIAGDVETIAELVEEGDA